jgi:putative drug exporter of the RND superfamily
LRGLASIVAGRRTKWVVLVIWIIAAVAMSPLGSKLSDVTTDDTESFLPSNAESTEVVRTLDHQFPAKETALALIVYQNKDGLTPANFAKIRSDAEKIKAEPAKIPLVQTPQAQGQAPNPVLPAPVGPTSKLVSANNQVAYAVYTLPTDFDHESDWGKAIRDITDSNTGEMNVYVTGDVGFNTDADEVFSNIDTKLLLATTILVLVLLGAIYRSVLVAISPLIVVFLAYQFATGLIYLFAKSGATVSSNSTGILVVLMFGVGTDYCLLLVSRYREELRRLEDKHDAMQRAVRRAGPAILASGLTVTLAMLVLVFAESGNTKSLGPVAAISVFCAMLAGLTVLPAVLTIFGRRGFWPRQSIVQYDPEHAEVIHTGLWRRFGDKVLHRPGPALAVTAGVFILGSLGLIAYKVDYSSTTFFKKSVESVNGFKVLSEDFPAGTLSPTTVLVERQNGPVTPQDLLLAANKLKTVQGVAGAAPTGEKSTDGKIGEVDAILKGDPNDVSALDLVPKMRDAVANLGPGVTALVGGGTAINYDYNKATERDLKLIVPLALLVMAIILGILLQAIVAPLVLLASVVLSFACTLGISIVFIRFVVGDAGFDASIPTFAFIFLVALGIDYTIFLMARVREEARHFGTREGMLRAIAATGPVITSAGVILAGTFSVLMTLPVTFTFDLGFMVALGILLDTFIVRTIMVPAAVELIGDKIWWPSTAAGGGRVLHEDTGEQPLPEPSEAG